MDNFDEKLKQIVLAGIGAIANTVEQTRDAIVQFSGSQQAKDLAKKGEEAVQSAVDAGSQAIKKVKDAFSEAEQAEQAKKEAERLKKLARDLHGLSPDHRAQVDALLAKLSEDPYESSFGPAEGKDPQSEEALGPPGVSGLGKVPFPDSKQDPATDQKSRKDPLGTYSATAPDDDHNVRRIQTDAMNEHLKQNVPPDF